MVAKSMLKQLGHNVDVVYNGMEAVGAVQQRHYDLILMDVCMPVMDGLQATKKIRSFEENAFRNDSVALNSPTDSPDAKKGCQRTTIIAD
ncbi:hypothetical protein HPP92_026134 [Vanilla planifolia]|uniref:Response regulatory domain-containing protein n=1 Tax=Vanilla planifolia TaxID=51239 RepID=A0A835PE53_VANPL|nr:hypothetical protein HPP92_026134 [Vanilla planifolia]